MSVCVRLSLWKAHYPSKPLSEIWNVNYLPLSLSPAHFHCVTVSFCLIHSYNTGPDRWSFDFTTVSALNHGHYTDLAPCTVLWVYIWPWIFSIPTHFIFDSCCEVVSSLRNRLTDELLCLTFILFWIHISNTLLYCYLTFYFAWSLLCNSNLSLQLLYTCDETINSSWTQGLS